MYVFVFGGTGEIGAGDVASIVAAGLDAVQLRLGELGEQVGARHDRHVPDRRAGDERRRIAHEGLVVFACDHEHGDLTQLRQPPQGRPVGLDRLVLGRRRPRQ